MSDGQFWSLFAKTFNSGTPTSASDSARPWLELPRSAHGVGPGVKGSRGVELIEQELVPLASTRIEPHDEPGRRGRCLLDDADLAMMDMVQEVSAAFGDLRADLDAGAHT